MCEPWIWIGMLLFCNMLLLVLCRETSRINELEERVTALQKDLLKVQLELLKVMNE